MESEVVYYAYAFDVKINGKKQTIYFENEYDAKMGRFIAYCHFDYQRLTIKGFVPPVSQPRKVMLRQKDLENITVFYILANNQISVLTLGTTANIVFVDLIVGHEIANFCLIGANPKI